MTRTQPAVVRYFMDANVLGLAKVLVQVRPDVTFPGDPGGELHRRSRPACVITSTDVADRDWIPVVASQQLIVVTRDGNIARHREELAAVRRSGARLVVLGGPEAISTWQQLEILLTQWRLLESWSLQPGPWIRRLTRTAWQDVLP